VLVPQKNDAQGRHGWRSQSSMGIFQPCNEELGLVEEVYSSRFRSER
jgi:hypothetical protein